MNSLFHTRIIYHIPTKKATIIYFRTIDLIWLKKCAIIYKISAKEVNHVTDVKQTIAKNITALRQSHKMTQIELAEKLNYSDKAVSKWERGESIPDVIVLKSISDLFLPFTDTL